MERSIKHAPLASPCGTLLLSLIWVIAEALVAPTSAHALVCGANNGYFCQGTQTQYGGTFNPGIGYGGFGGGSCTATKTPVIFVHGNGDNAISFDLPPARWRDMARRPARSMPS